MNYDAALFVGHGTSDLDGSYDPGATFNGKQEHVIAEKITDKAVALCKNRGINIHRDEQNYKDNDLLGNTYNYKSAFSIHLNAGKGQRAEIFAPCKEKYLDVEFYIMAELAKLGLANGGVKSRDYNSEKTFTRTNGVTLPYNDYYGEIGRAWAQGISLDIIEIGFIDSADLQIIESNIDNIATIIANGMCKICGKPTFTVGGNVPPVDQPINTVYYRVRKTWSDSTSQKGAFSQLEYAKIECNKYSGYSVFDDKGNKVYPVSQPIPSTPSVSGEYEITRYPEPDSTFTCTEDSIYFRNKPYVGNDNPVQGHYSRNNYVHYDTVVVTNKYTWISWVSESTNIRRYMPVRDMSTGEAWGTFR